MNKLNLPELGNMDSLWQFDEAHEPLPLLNGSDKLIVSADPLLPIGTEMWTKIHREVLRGFALESLHMTTPSVASIIPEERHQYAADGWLVELHKLRETDPEWYAEIVDVGNEAVSRGIIRSKAVGIYAAYAFGSPISLGPSLGIVESSMAAPPDQRNVVYKPAAERCPTLVSFANSLGFVRVDKILCLSFLQHQGIQTHVDFTVRSNYDDLSIGIFDRPGHPLYVWDSLRRVKHYIQQDSHSFIFNSHQWHGVDPMLRPSYIIRIDGQPTPALRSKVMELR